MQIKSHGYKTSICQDGELKATVFAISICPCTRKDSPDTKYVIMCLEVKTMGFLGEYLQMSFWL